MASEQLAGLLDAAKSLLQLGGEDFPLRCDLDTRAVALEQPAAEVLLQRFDVLADRARGEMQLLGGQRERAGTGGAFEGAQGVKRRKELAIAASLIMSLIHSKRQDYSFFKAGATA